MWAQPTAGATRRKRFKHGLVEVRSGSLHASPHHPRPIANAWLFPDQNSNLKVEPLKLQGIENGREVHQWLYPQIL